MTPGPSRGRRRRAVGHLGLATLLLAAAAPLGAQGARGTLTIAAPLDPSPAIPTLIVSTPNQDVADHLFLRLARPGPRLETSGDAGFEPQLARRWTRRDSLTLAFELDPRLRWHDGQPVTSEDVVATFVRARDPRLSPRLASALREISDVRAEGPGIVVVRFARAYAEQLFDATFHVQPLPAHHLRQVAPDSLATSAFARAPVGNGPFRWGRLVPGEFLELRAHDGFALGRPSVERLVVRVAPDPTTQLALVLAGEADATLLTAPPGDVAERARRAGARTVPVPTLQLQYLLLNTRRRGDRSAPHPALADRRVREALKLALDRQTIVRAAFGDYGAVPFGPMSQLQWVNDPALRAAPADPARARRLLAEAGWRDADVDGTLERDGAPLALTMLVPSPSTPRRLMAAAAQEQWRRVGVPVDVQVVDPPVYLERRARGDFDVDFAGVVQDPSPSTLLQAWTCAGVGTTANVASVCDPVADSLLAAARTERRNPRAAWHAVLRRFEAETPAIFMAAPAAVVLLGPRVTEGPLRLDGTWRDAWRWTVRDRRTP